MKNQYTINIPKPCSESWDAMTPNSNGHHCLSCVKTVVDFTQMDRDQIQTYLSERSSHHICGRIKQKHLSVISIEIPTLTFRKKMSIHKIFLLALLISMGTTLLSCSDGITEAQKIESVSIVASKEDIQEKVQQELDTLAQKAEEEASVPMIMGVLEVPVTGEIQITKGDHSPLPFIHADQPPEFRDTPKELTTDEKRKHFGDQVRKHITTNFVVATFEDLELSSRQRIYAKFTITETGTLKDIQIRAQHPELEKYAIKIIKKLPLFKPAMHKGEPRDVVYMVPIIFQPT